MQWEVHPEVAEKESVTIVHLMGKTRRIGKIGNFLTIARTARSH
jgi:hypothetical protein